MQTDPEATVRELLAAQGIAPPDDEIATLAQSYPGLRAAADALYLPEAEAYLPAFASPTVDLANFDLEAR